MAPRFALLFSGDVPAEGLVRIPLATAGRWVKGKIKAAVSKADLAQMAANFRKRKTGDLVIDYEHSTEFAAGTGDAAPAAGWLKRIEDEPAADGVLYGWAEFCERAAGMLRSKEYKYISPVIVWGAKDPNTGEPQGTTLTSVALTNSPLMQELPAIAFSEAGWELDRGDAAGQGGKVQKLIMADRVARTVRVIGDDGAESTLPVEGLEAPPTVVRFSDVKRGSDGRLDFSTLPQGDALVAGEVVSALLAQHELDAAVAKGLITPAQRPFYEKMAFSDLAGFRALAATMKPAVDLAERGIGSGAEGGEMNEFGKVEAAVLAKVSEKLAANNALQYHEALKLVASENPELNRKYTDLARKRMGGRD